ncbi:bifunctional ADP-dependent NAD(P)H-hydrate dehydratase/NAD(P)H-hydrate epimerase [bacterium]|nr:MAG: bifunctional ADP-dependent NAD(P)H-hydrate dehydratase/NAD(P)H-hydrate epimerase [bacterium]
MRVCTNDQMRKLDSLTIQKYNVSGEILMERAGRWVASVALDIMEKSKSNTVCIVAGRGNNGGDGFVVARYLSQIGFDVQIILCAEPDDITGDASLNFEKVKQEKINWKKFDGNIPKTDLIVDALLGTGISGAPRSPLNKAINIINEHHNNGAFVLAVDIPSGVNGDNGEVAGDAVYADCTITFGFPKLGHFFHPGKKHTGMLYIADIGLDSRAISEVSADYEFASIQTINELLPYRPPDGHKGTFGKGLIVACSAGMTGAGIMAGISFLRSGAGLCYLAVPRSLTDIVDSSATEVVVLPMPEVRRKRCHTLRALGELHKYAQNVDAIAIGPGLGTHFETRDMVKKFLTKVRTPVVIDADGINALAGEINETIPKITADSVMTPHPGELSRLLEIPIEKINNKKIDMAKEWAKLLFTNLLIKGNPTLITSAENPIWINPVGNDGMATAGSGDVLTGLLTGFIAQGISPFHSACMGTYIHGLAGEIAAQKFTARAMLATDILSSIPDAIRVIENAPAPERRSSDKLKFDYIHTDIGIGIARLDILE